MVYSSQRALTIDSRSNRSRVKRTVLNYFAGFVSKDISFKFRSIIPRLIPHYTADCTRNRLIYRPMRIAGEILSIFIDCVRFSDCVAVCRTVPRLLRIVFGIKSDIEPPCHFRETGVRITPNNCISYVAQTCITVNCYEKNL